MDDYNSPQLAYCYVYVLHLYCHRNITSPPEVKPLNLIICVAGNDVFLYSQELYKQCQRDAGRADSLGGKHMSHYCSV